MPKPEQPSNGEPEFKAQYLPNIGSAQFANGTEVPVDGIIMGEKGVIDEVTSRYEQDKVRDLFDSKKGSSKSHGMPGVKRWGAKWQPKGPNLSWQKPDQN